jgi:hypothetical protein
MKLSIVIYPKNFKFNNKSSALTYGLSDLLNSSRNSLNKLNIFNR